MYYSLIQKNHQFIILKLPGFTKKRGGGQKGRNKSNKNEKDKSKTDRGWRMERKCRRSKEKELWKGTEFSPGPRHSETDGM